MVIMFKHYLVHVYLSFTKHLKLHNKPLFLPSELVRIIVRAICQYNQAIDC